MLVVSNDTLARVDGPAVQNLINELASKTNLINEEEGWNGINILHQEASRVGALDLGVVPRPSMEGAKVVVLLIVPV